MLQVELDCGAPGTSAQQTEYTDAQCTNRSADTHKKVEMLGLKTLASDFNKHTALDGLEFN